MRLAWMRLLATGLFLCGCAQATTGTPPATTDIPPVATRVPINTPAASPTPFGPPSSPTPAPTQASLFAPVSEADWQTGPATAAVTLIVYSDFQSPFCAALELVLARLRTEYPDDLRVVFRQYPLPQHDKARLAAQAAEAAGAQGKFWEMQSELFANQPDWADLTPVAFKPLLAEYADTIGLDQEEFRAALDSQETVARVETAYVTARDTPIPGTPFVLFNGEPFQDQGLTNHWALSTLIRLERLKAHQLPPPPEVIDPFKTYAATLHTELGEVVIELYGDKVPLTVNNFVYLAREGWYDDVTFHRVITGFAAQAGDPSGTGYGGPGYFIPDEIVPELRFDGPGWVGMANAGPDTNGSQFFITLAARPEFDGKYTLFGKVIRGLDVVQALIPRDPNIDAEAPPGSRINTVTIEEK
jgi:cyclophilin family peptidyl-prolyl cis-trans isomerase/protein-disulfide isomerase